MAINRRESTLHPAFDSAGGADGNGKLKKLHSAKKSSAASYEALIVLEIDRHSDPADLRGLEETLQSVLHEVRIAVDDFPIVKDKVSEILGELDATTAGISEEDKEEARAFLGWLTEDHFTFLGYDEYDFVKEKQGMAVRRVENSSWASSATTNARTRFA